MRRTRTQTMIAAALLAEPDIHHYGRSLCQATGLAGGTVYPMLARFAEAGLLEELVEDGSGSSANIGPARRYYALTPLGRAELAEMVPDPPIVQEPIGKLALDDDTSTGAEAEAVMLLRAADRTQVLSGWAGMPPGMKDAVVHLLWAAADHAHQARRVDPEVLTLARAVLREGPAVPALRPS